MTLIAVTSTRSSPGVSALAVGLGYVWQQLDHDPLLVEADPAGGVLGLRFGLSAEPSLVTLSSDMRRGFDATMVANNTRLLQDVPCVLAPVDPVAATRVLDRNGEKLADGFASLGRPVVADLGRLQVNSPALALASRSQRVLVVSRPRVDEVQSLLFGIRLLKARGCQVSLVLVGNRPFHPDEIADLAGVPLAAVLPDEKLLAGALTGGSFSPRKLRRSLLWRSITALGTSLLEQYPVLPAAPPAPSPPTAPAASEPAPVAPEPVVATVVSDPVVATVASDPVVAATAAVPLSVDPVVAAPDETGPVPVVTADPAPAAAEPAVTLAGESSLAPTPGTGVAELANGISAEDLASFPPPPPTPAPDRSLVEALADEDWAFNTDQTPSETPSETPPPEDVRRTLDAPPPSVEHRVADIADPIVPADVAPELEAATAPIDPPADRTQPSAPVSLAVTTAMSMRPDGSPYRRRLTDIASRSRRPQRGSQTRRTVRNRPSSAEVTSSRIDDTVEVQSDDGEGWAPPEWPPPVPDQTPSTSSP